MLIDAMRYDFIFEQNLNQDEDNGQKKSTKIRMPFVQRLLREHKAKPFKLNARPPTVTLPRIKVIRQHLDIRDTLNSVELKLSIILN